MFYKRTAITTIFETKITELNDLTDLTEGFLIELRENIYYNITEVFTQDTLPSITNGTSLNIKSI